MPDAFRVERFDEVATVYRDGFQYHLDSENNLIISSDANGVVDIINSVSWSAIHRFHSDSSESSTESSADFKLFENLFHDWMMKHGVTPLTITMSRVELDINKLKAGIISLLREVENGVVPEV